jgi:hypothetical protein
MEKLFIPDDSFIKVLRVIKWWILFVCTVRAGDLGHFDKNFSINLFSYLAAKYVLQWLGIIF